MSINVCQLVEGFIGGKKEENLKRRKSALSVLQNELQILMSTLMQHVTNLI